MCQDIVSPVISHSWELFISVFLINFLLNHFIYLWRTGLENLFVKFYVFVVQQYRTESSQSVTIFYEGARSFYGAENTSTWTFRPHRCGNTSGNSSSPSTTASPRGEPRYRSELRPTANNKVWPKNLEGQQKQCRIPSWNCFQIFHFKIAIALQGQMSIVSSCSFFTFPLPFLQKPSTALLEEVEKENNIKNNDYVSNHTFGHNKVFLFLSTFSLTNYSSIEKN